MWRPYEDTTRPAAPPLEYALIYRPPSFPLDLFLNLVCTTKGRE